MIHGPKWGSGKSVRRFWAKVYFWGGKKIPTSKPLPRLMIMPISALLCSCMRQTCRGEIVRKRITLYLMQGWGCLIIWYNTLESVGITGITTWLYFVERLKRLWTFPSSNAYGCCVLYFCIRLIGNRQKCLKKKATKAGIQVILLMYFELEPLLTAAQQVIWALKNQSHQGDGGDICCRRQAHVVRPEVRCHNRQFDFNHAAQQP